MSDAAAILPAPKRVRTWSGVPLLLAFLAAAFIVHLMVGTRLLSPETVVQALLAADPGNFDHAIVANLRLPRAVIAAVVGAALSVAGALMQGVTRNPLADPALLGLTAGASFAVVMATALFGLGGSFWLPWIAAAGALAAALVVYFIARRVPGGAALEPDLIITAAFNETPLAQLEKIAPTVVVEDNMRGEFVTFDRIADLTGTPDRLAVLKQRYRGQIDQIRELIAGRDTTASIILTQSGQIAAWHTYGSLGKVLRDAGVRFPRIIDTIEGSDRVLFSGGQLPAFDADFIFATYDIPREEASAASYYGLGVLSYMVISQISGRQFERMPAASGQ